MSYSAPTLASGASTALGALNNGGFALAWLVQGAPGADASVQMQRFNPRGKPTGGAVTISLDRPLASAGLGVLADGSLVVAFVEVVEDIPAFVEWRKLLIGRFDRNGNPIGSVEAVRVFRNSLMSPNNGPSGEVHVIPTLDGGFALAWVNLAGNPGYPTHTWDEVQLFDASAQPGAQYGADTGRPDLSLTRIEPLPGGGVLVQRTPDWLPMQAVWEPVGSSSRKVGVPATAYGGGGVGLPIEAQLVPLAGGGYVALLETGLQFFDDTGQATGSAVPVAEPGTLLALAGGGFAIFTDGMVQVYGSGGQPAGSPVAAALPGQLALAGGGVVAVQAGAGSFTIDLLAPTH